MLIRPSVCQELKEELESARLQIEDLTRQVAEAIEERVLAWQNATVPVLTWHDLIERAIALLTRHAGRLAHQGNEPVALA
jgi:hypothetical protein